MLRLLLVPALVGMWCAGTAGAQPLDDEFDIGSLDGTKWTTRQIRQEQISFVSDSRCGASAIAVTSSEGDGGIQCDDCQRAEIRTAKTFWPSFGEEVWFQFSFRVDGDIPTIGSARTVIGQWKGPGDGSPMLAQRFDNGVFHITVQDNDRRLVVASAEGNPDDVQAADASLSKLETGDGLVARQSADPAKLAGRAQVEVMPDGDAVLPDPRKDWVDMVYRIKPGRTDNERGPRRKGEIDIWATGKKIVSVRGEIGATLRQSDDIGLVGPYFKFGIYRSNVPGTLQFRFDEFSQARSREELPRLCEAK